MTDRLLVLVRHGESEWNLRNLFTGWKDVGLTEKGIAEARAAGRKLEAQGIRFDVGFTSALVRAQHSLELILEEMGQRTIPVLEDMALNERDYGDLSGLNKDDARARWGAEQVHIWRRSYDVPPPGGESSEGHGGAGAAVLHSGNSAAGVTRPARSGRRSRQFAAGTRHGAGTAFDQRYHQARDRHRGTPDLSAQSGFRRWRKSRISPHRARSILGRAFHVTLPQFNPSRIHCVCAPVRLASPSRCSGAQCWR